MMALLFSQSGLIQTVTPSRITELYQGDGAGGEAVLENIQIAKPDPDAPINVAPYDGDSAFGLFNVDVSLDGGTT